MLSGGSEYKGGVAMIDFQCPQCKVLLHAPERYQGSAGNCTHCGAAIQVPKAAPAGNAKPNADAAKQDESHHRFFWTIASVAWALLLVLGMIALIRGADGSALTLAVFSSCFTIGAVSVLSAIVVFVLPELPVYLESVLPKWGTIILLLLTSTVGFFFAWLTYSP